MIKHLKRYVKCLIHLLMLLLSKGTAMFIDIFNDLLEENNINRKQFSEKSGIPYTTVIGWTTLNRLPDFTALIKIADFFNCSIDYLTERQESLGSNFFTGMLAEQEKDLIKTFRKLDSESKHIVISLAHKLETVNAMAKNKPQK